MTPAITAAIVSLAAPAQAQLYQSPIRLAQAPSYYHADDGDPATTTHECTHWANSQLRTRYGGYGFYIGQGQFLWVRTKPAMTLGSVSRYVRYRGQLAQQYLERSRYPLQPQVVGPGMLFAGHEQDPLFLFDELSAYLAGAGVAVSQRDYTNRVQSACEMAHYAASLWRGCPASYADREPLRRAWLDMALRIDAIARRAARVGQYTQGTASWHRVLVQDIQQMRAAR